MRTSLKYVVALGLAGAALLAAAHAGERLETRHVIFGLDKSEDLEIGRKHALTTVRSDEIAVADALAEDHPLQYLSGGCAGSVETRDGVAKGGGTCVYTNAKGGKWVLTWDVGSLAGENGGTYQIVGTEGNALGWKGAGKWLESGAHFSEHRYVQRWVGWIEKP